MTYSDIQTFPSYSIEILNEIMILEEQYQQKEINKQSGHGQNYSHRVTRRR